VPVRFALDQNFPATILDSLGLGVPDAELVPLTSIDARLTEVDDSDLLRALHCIGGFDGLVTTDSSMLQLPFELAIIHQTKLTIVSVEESGHDPVRALGLLLTHLPGICKKSVKATGQAWRLRYAQKNHEDPWELLKRVAKHQGTDPNSLYKSNCLTIAQLSQNPLAQTKL